jgi:hypothetical protein
MAEGFTTTVDVPTHMPETQVSLNVHWLPSLQTGGLVDPFAQLSSIPLQTSMAAGLTPFMSLQSVLSRTKPDG